MLQTLTYNTLANDKMAAIFLSLSLIGGFYSDTVAYVNDGCKMCPTGTFVPYDKAPGTSAGDCIACPQGKSYQTTRT